MKRITTYNLKNLLLSICIILLVYSSKAQIQKGSDIDGEAAYSFSGTSVSMPDNNTVAIGAPNNSQNGLNVGGGHVRIYNWIGNNWIQKGDDIDGQKGSSSGEAVSMPDANTVAIGAPYGDGIGHVRIYIWNGTTWIRKGTDIIGESFGDRFGSSVSMPDSNTVAIGAYQNYGINGPEAGQVCIYTWNGTRWVKKGKDIDGTETGGWFGRSISMPNANTVAIGASAADANGVDAGRVRVYHWNGTGWAQKGSNIFGEAAGDEAGYAVSMPDSNTIAIGARKNDGNGSNSGHVRVFNWDGFDWTQKGLDIDGENPGDGSGNSVSMSDANTIAIGAIYNFNFVSGAAGHVRIFKWNGNKWAQILVDIDGEAPGDYCGKSVSMPDSNTVAIGAGENNGIGPLAGYGHVRVYTLDESSIIENSFGNSLKAFPNPTHGDINIELGANYNDVSVIVRNSVGQDVMRKTFSNANSLQLNIPGEAGFYIVEVAAQDKKALLKLMKK